MATLLAPTATTTAAGLRSAVANMSLLVPATSAPMTNVYAHLRKKSIGGGLDTSREKTGREQAAARIC